MLNNIEIRNMYGDIVYRIEANRIYDAYGSCKYEVRGDDLFDASGNMKYGIRDRGLFDALGRKKYEIRDGYLCDTYENRKYEIRDVRPVATPSGTRPNGGGEPEGCWGCLSLYLGFLLRLNRGGKIGAGIGIAMVIMQFVKGEDMPAGNYIIAIFLFPLIFGIIGSVIGGIIDKK